MAPKAVRRGPCGSCGSRSPRRGRRGWRPRSRRLYAPFSSPRTSAGIVRDARRRVHPRRSITLPPMTATTTVQIPADLKPADGRFGCGPSKVRPEALAGRCAEGADLMGTSHRQAPVRELVGPRPRRPRASCLGLPDGYEVVLGNGGTTAFWDAAAAFGWCASAPSTSAYGEFSPSSPRSRRHAPFLARPDRAHRRAGRRARPGRRSRRRRDRLGAQRDLDRRDGRRGPPGRRRRARRSSTRTSGAGGLPVDAAPADAYYFAPQKSFARRRRPVARGAEPGGDRADRAARRRRRPLASRLPLARGRRWRTRARTRPTTRPRWRPCCCSPTSSTGCSAGGGLGLAAWRARRASSGTSTAGRRRPSSPRRSSPTRPSARSSWARSTSPTRSTPPPWPRRCAPTASSTSSPTASWGATSFAIGMFPAVEPADVRGAHRLHRLAIENAPGCTREGPGQGEDRRLRRRAAARELRGRPRLEMARSELRDAIGEYDAILIRSATKLTPGPDRAGRQPQGDRPRRHRGRQRRHPRRHATRHRRRQRPASRTRSPRPSTRWRCCSPSAATCRGRTPR